jgi:GR25 family glycosyltransferase involved in LPS biosynthesis
MNLNARHNITRLYRRLRINAELWSLKRKLKHGLLRPVSGHHDLDDLDVVYINLDRDEERKIKIEAMLSRLNIKARRFPAIEVNQESMFNAHQILVGREFSDFMKNEDGLGYRNLAHVGCYLSHRQIMQAIPENKSGFTLILEDDVRIAAKDFFHYAYYTALNTKLDWDILLFDCGGPYKESDRIGWNIYFPSDNFPNYWGTHSVLVRNSSALRIVAELDASEVSCVDAIYTTNKTGIKTYVVRTGLCSQ